MISMRYHIISLAAAFLALALGIVLGATKINAPWLAGLQSDSASLTEQRAELQAENDALTSDVAAGQDMAEAAVGGLGPRRVPARPDGGADHHVRRRRRRP